MRLLLSSLGLILITVSSFSQKQTSIWLDRFYGLDFNTYPPTSSTLTARSLYTSSRASVADSAGNLLFYTDGLNFYDKNGQLMPDGAGLSVSWGTTYLPFIIAPVPKSHTKYYAFTVRVPKSSQNADFDRSLRYNLIDMQQNGGKGNIVQKGIEIAPDQRDEFTLIKTPDDTQGYWLVSVSINNSTVLSAYRITAAGIAQKPVNTQTGSFISQSLIKSSPDGRFLALNSTPGDATNRLKIFQFNSKTGGFALFREIITHAANPNSNQYPYSQTYNTSPEFSSDSRFLYVQRDSVNHIAINQTSSYSKIISYDMTAPDNRQFLQSEQVLYQFEANDFPAPGNMQLSPQRKIIVSNVVGNGYFHTIHYPKACRGAEKQFERNAIRLPSAFYSYIPLFTPVFPSWYFYEPRFAERFAGKDTLVCPNQTITLGYAPKSGYQYEWQAISGLQQLNVPNPVYQTKNNISGKNDTTFIHLKAIDPTGCVTFDSVRIITKSVKKWRIQGSKSVCPGVKEVKYWIDNGWKGKKISWQLNGGTIVKGQNTDTIFVNWSIANLSAAVGCTAENENGCFDSVDDFPVKVFKFLETEKPKGRDTLQCNQFVETYSILPTNGSLYDWQVINGTILAGQGSHKVTIQWNENLTAGKVWINESVNTDLEICFGRSDTLYILNPAKAGNENLFFYSVSNSLGHQDRLLLNFELKKRVFYKKDILLQRKEPAQKNWQTVGTLNAATQAAFFDGQALGQQVFDYRLVAFTTCNDSVFSTIHNNILLSYQGFEMENYIQLNWNPYKSWQSGVDKYEVYRKLDNADVFDLQGFSESNLFKSEKISDGFIHCFYLKALSADKQYVSYSNTICPEFENPLFLPNLITPNGDTKNETWNPFPLELYPENELVVFNRWGTEVYKAKNYTGDWSGNNLSNGIYFYEFRTVAKNRIYRGYIQLLR